MAVKKFGGGSEQWLTIRVKGKQRRILVRLGIYGLRWFGVIQRPLGLAGQIAVYNHDRQCWQVVASIYHAYRQIWHILWQHGVDVHTGEKSRILKVIELARELNAAALGVSAATVSQAELRQQLRPKIYEASRLLGRPLRPSKQKAKQQLVAIGAAQDSRGRINPTVQQVRSISAVNRLWERLEDEILVIDPQMRRRQEVVVTLIQWAELVVWTTYEFLLLLVRNGGMVHPFLDSHRREVARLAIFYAQGVERIDYLPFRGTCHETASDLRKLAAIIEANRGAELQKQIPPIVRVCRSALLLKRMQFLLEDWIDGVARELAEAGCSRFPFTTLRRDLEVMRRELRKIGDRGFRKPVCQSAIAALDETLTLFVEDGQPELGRLKDSLKAISFVL
ncbi:MAG: hypothetical protein Q8Q20_04485 [bacterium]|nr:hypothetical protein [bacterium]